jgi:hypothetical protein
MTDEISTCLGCQLVCWMQYCRWGSQLRSIIILLIEAVKVTTVRYQYYRYGTYLEYTVPDR